MSFALYNGEDPGTGHLVGQLTHCPSAQTVSVGLLFALPRKCYHVLSEPEQTLVLGISVVCEHSVHLPYQKE
jgi:hypothetical protein